MGGAPCSQFLHDEEKIMIYIYIYIIVGGKKSSLFLSYKKMHLSTVTILFWFGHSPIILQVKFLSWSEMNYTLLHSNFLPE